MGIGLSRDAIKAAILTAREHVARAVDSGLVALHGEVGHRIRAEVLHQARATYGAAIVSTVSRQLGPEFGGASAGTIFSPSERGE